MKLLSTYVKKNELMITTGDCGTEDCGTEDTFEWKSFWPKNRIPRSSRGSR